MRTLTELLKTKEKVFIRLANDNLKQKFLQQAEDEGFVYQGQNPTTLQAESVMIIHNDYTLGKLVGFATHMHYCTCQKEMRVDYARYINGLDDYNYDVKKERYNE